MGNKGSTESPHTLGGLTASHQREVSQLYSRERVARAWSRLVASVGLLHDAE